MNCKTCHQNITQAVAWCAMRLNTYPTLWTAKQAAHDCGCSVTVMCQEMSKWFPDHKYMRDLRCILYCVDRDARFRGAAIMSHNNKTLIEMWRGQHIVKALARAADAL